MAQFAQRSFQSIDIPHFVQKNLAHVKIAQSAELNAGLLEKQFIELERPS